MPFYLIYLMRKFCKTSSKRVRNCFFGGRGVAIFWQTVNARNWKWKQVYEIHCVVVNLYQLYLPPKFVVQELCSPSSWLLHGKTWLADNRYGRNNVTKATKAELLMENNRGCHNFLELQESLFCFRPTSCPFRHLLPAQQLCNLINYLKTS